MYRTLRIYAYVHIKLLQPSIHALASLLPRIGHFVERGIGKVCLSISSSMKAAMCTPYLFLFLLVPISALSQKASLISDLAEAMGLHRLSVVCRLSFQERKAVLSSFPSILHHDIDSVRDYPDAGSGVLCLDDYKPDVVRTLLNRVGVGHEWIVVTNGSAAGFGTQFWQRVFFFDAETRMLTESYSAGSMNFSRSIGQLLPSGRVFVQVYSIVLGTFKT